jgi:hypothetical protein
MKLFAALVTTLVLTLVVTLEGMVAAPVASAAPYPHTVTTYCHAQAKPSRIPSSVRPKFYFWITTNGNGRPQTRVNITIERISDGSVVHRTHRRYDERRELWRFKTLRPGLYRFVFRTRVAENSVYKNCSVSRRLRVTR